MPVEKVEDLRKLRTDHDGIVWDEFSPEEFKPSELLCLFDLESKTTMNARYENIIIRKDCPRIFTVNNDFNESLNKMIIPKKQLSAIYTPTTQVRNRHCPFLQVELK